MSQFELLLRKINTKPLTATAWGIMFSSLHSSQFQRGEDPTCGKMKCPESLTTLRPVYIQTNYVNEHKMLGICSKIDSIRLALSFEQVVEASLYFIIIFGDTDAGKMQLGWIFSLVGSGLRNSYIRTPSGQDGPTMQSSLLLVSHGASSYLTKVVPGMGAEHRELGMLGQELHGGSCC